LNLKPAVQIPLRHNESLWTKAENKDGPSNALLQPGQVYRTLLSSSTVWNNMTRSCLCCSPFGRNNDWRFAASSWAYCMFRCRSPADILRERRDGAERAPGISISRPRSFDKLLVWHVILSTSSLQIDMFRSCYSIIWIIWHLAPTRFMSLIQSPRTNHIFSSYGRQQGRAH
jgi:hypothetical protein